MSSDNTFFGAKGMKPSPHLHDQPSDMNEIAGRDPRKRSQKNPIGTPTVGKGSMEHAGTVKSGGPKNEGRLKSLNANILKENEELIFQFVKNGILSYQIIRDMDIYEKFNSLDNLTNEIKYILLADEFELSKSRIEQIITSMKNEIK